MRQSATDLQKGIIYHCRASDATSLYSTQVEILLSAEIDLQLLHDAWSQTVKQCHWLAAGLDENGNFVFNNAFDQYFSFHDLSADIEPVLKYQLLKEKDSKQGISISAPVLNRLNVFQVSAQDFRLLWTHHHILFDASSFVRVIDLFLKNYLELKNSLLFNKNYFSDFLIPSIDLDSNYWKTLLEDSEGAQPLYLKSEAPSQDKRPDSEFFAIGAEVINSLNKVANSLDITLNTLLQAAWGIVHSRYANKKEVCFGAVRAFPRDMVNDSFGLFINTLPVCATPFEHADFAGYLLDIRRQHQKIRDQVTCSMIDVYQCSGLRAGEVLFDVAFDYKPQALNEWLSEEITQHIAVNINFFVKTHYGLMIEIFPVESGLGGRFTYNASIYSLSGIKQLIESYQTVLESIAFQDFSTPLNVQDIPVISEWDKQQQLFHWNETKKDLPSREYLHRLVEHSVKKYSNKLAVTSSRGNLSYDLMNCKANQIAHCLRRVRVQPNELIAIVMEKGWEQVVAALAILKAGAAYMPVSADFPESRIHQLLQQGEVRYVLTQSQYTSGFHWPSEVQVLSVDDEKYWDSYSVQNLEPIQQLGDLAYVIFTSGSTGTPKGVMIDHLGAMNTIQDMNARFGVNENDSVLGLSALNFDLSVYDIFGILGAGGLLVLPKEEDRKDPAVWLSLVEKYHITIWDTVPALMQMLVEYGLSASQKYIARKICSSLRLVLMSGDWIPLDLPSKIKTLCGPSVQMMSLGGATEASIWSILYPIIELDPAWRAIPYGRPMYNQTFYILDEFQRLLPVGVPGELHIGGMGVAKGYWKDHERTEKSFIQHPTLGRLYRTGDMGRYSHDGVIEFMGRVDHQVKIRGYRIELGEIEFILKECPEIKEVLVRVYEGEQGDQSLVAYYTSTESNSTIEENLKNHARKNLPGYMVPNVFVSLSHFPLSSNGKVDHKALPAPSLYFSQTAKRLPKNEKQEILLKIWQRLLNFSEISIEDNFFSLGGHSLTALQLVTQLKKEYGYEISIREIFIFPTIESLSENLRNVKIDSAILNSSQRISEESLISRDQMRRLPRKFAIIGETSLLILCAEHILRSDFHSEVVCVCTEDPEVTRWCYANNIHAISNLRDFISYLEKVEVDYLFSIVNRYYLSSLLLDSVKKLAINYHNALLPRYAGVNATSWSILNGEKEHGISWHIITDQFDAGDILEQIPIPIEENETALTLNVKCYEAASLGFKILLHKLMMGELVSLKQNLDKRSYYGYSNQIPGFEIIDWNNTAEHIDRMVRSCTLGAYANTFGLVKCIIANKIYYVEQVEKVESFNPGLVPGSIIAFKDDNFIVQTSTIPLRLKKIIDLEGKPVDCRNLSENYELSVGMRLPMCTSSDDTLSKSAGSLRRCEAYWIDQFLRAEPFCLSDTFKQEDLPKCHVDFPLASFGLDSLEEVIALIFTYFYRIGDQKAGSYFVGIRSQVKDFEAAAIGIFADYLPLSLALTGEELFSDIVASVGIALQMAQKNKTFTQDLFVRYSALKDTLIGARLFPPVVVHIGNIEDIRWGITTQLAIVISHDHKSCRFIGKLSEQELWQIFKRMEVISQNIKSAKKISCLPLLSNGEYEQIVSQGSVADRPLPHWNETKKDLPNREYLHRLVEHRVEQYPNKLAIASSRGDLSYDLMNRKSNQIAHHLRSLGVQPNELVAIVMEKGWEQVVASLAIMKAGGAYLPISAEFPESRIHQLLQQGEVRYVLTQSHYPSSIKCPSNILCFSVDDEASWSGYPEHNLSIVQKLDDLAYVIFTSGSTGTPKGVMIDHLGAMNTIQDINLRFSITEKDVILGLSALNFDLSVYDIFGVLGAGGLLVLPSEAGRKDPAVWLSLIERYGVTIWDTVPALMQMLVEYGLSKNHEDAAIKICSHIRLVLMSGDWIPLDLPQKIKKLCADQVEVTSLGGATEASIWSILHPIDCVSPSWRAIPYGRPMWNQTFHILDEFQRLLPVGVPGELYIGGIGLAKGYWKDAVRTNKSFIQHPVLGMLYRTGDMGRYNYDGVIEFMGRVDHQVKIRGYRIELGEIEFVLKECAGIKEVLVRVYEGERGDQSLVAYYTSREQGAAIEDDLKNHARKNLPDYMVPATFISLPFFPLSINGKVDYKALPAPSSHSPKAAKRKPENEKQEILIKIWQRLLNISEISIDDNFFSLGGHSLTALQMATQLKEEYGYEIAIKDVFVFPTVETLSKNFRESKVEAITLHASAGKSKDQAMSPAQKRIWFLSQLVPDKPLYNITFCHKISGQLHPDRLEKALNQLIGRQKMLQAEFIESDGEVIQKFNSNAKVELHFRKQKNNPTPRELQILSNEQNSVIFDLGKSPLFRVTLLTAKSESALIVTVHHIIFDAWSIDLFLKELSDLYEGKQLVLLGEFDQSGFREKEVEKVDLTYWRSLLNPLPAPFQLSVMKNRPAFPSYLGKTHYLELPVELVLRLRELSKNLKVTLSNLFLATFFIILKRYKQQDGFCVGMPVTLRNSDALGAIIGCYLNILLVRFSFSENERFSEMLPRLQAEFLEMMEHTNVPYEVLVESLQLERSVDHNALFQLMFSYQHSGFGNKHFSDYKMQSVPTLYETAKFDLTAFVFDCNEQKIDIAFEYSLDVFDHATIEQFLEHYINLLSDVTKRSKVEIKDIVLIGDRESAKQLNDWNQTQKEFSREFYLHTLIESAAVLYPAKLAVGSSRGNLDYQSLNERANRIGHCLRSLDARPNELVAIVMEKGWEQVVAALAILKAGAAYMPVSADFPESRIHQLLQQGEVRYVLTQSQYTSGFQWPSEVQVLSVDDEKYWDSYSIQNLEPIQQLEDLAYVIFTSGSTGTPKGVMIDHLGAMNTIQDMNARFGVNENDSVLGLSALNFDLSVYDIFGILGAGGLLVLPNEEDRKDPAVWLSLVEQYHITIWDTVPALMQMLVEYGLSASQKYIARKICSSLRLVLMSGDWIPLDLPSKIKTLCGPSVQMMSLGGATEASIWSILYPITELDPAWRAIPYGRPMYNQTFYILDEFQRLLPVGVPGELHIGGMGVAKGYWKDHERTEKSFIQHPTLGRLYRTGDMGRYSHDGVIEFMGRLDHQVKIRGYRIELGEIEFCLTQHPNIDKALVIEKNIDNQQNLVAYVTAFKEISVDEIRSYLQSQLPAYMVPAYLMLMESFPLSANGKVDRKQLPEPVAALIQSESPYVPPLGVIEEILAALYAKILNLPKVGRHDSFFVLGGHSMLATKLLIGIEEVFSVKLMLRTIFESHVLQEMAKRIEELSEAQLVSQTTQSSYEEGVL